MKNERTRAYYRDVRHKAICKKKYIDMHINGNIERPLYSNTGQYSKNKVHCSCPICKYGKTYHVPKKRDILADIIEKQQLKEII